MPFKQKFITCFLFRFHPFFGAGRSFHNGIMALCNKKCVKKQGGQIYLMGPYNAGPKSALFLRVAEIRAGFKRAGWHLKGRFLLKNFPSHDIL